MNKESRKIVRTGKKNIHTILTVDEDTIGKNRLEGLLHQATNLSGIGCWDLNLVDNTLYWSDVTKQIYEVKAGYVPDFASSLLFYKNKSDQDKITHHINLAVKNGLTYEVELQITTALGNNKWVSIIGEPEFKGGKVC